MAKYRTTRHIWTGKDGQTKLPAGSLVEFDGEPTGVYVGRVERLPEEEQAKRGKKADLPPPPVA